MDNECESGNCGSRRFHTGDDGFTYCEEGHRQWTTGLVTATETDLEPTGRRTIRKAHDEQDPVVLTGREGLEHHIVCFQLLLWKQVHSLIADAGFPAELEVIVRDLWALRLTTLQHRLASRDLDKEATTQMFSSQGETSESDTGSRKRRNSRRGDDALPRIIDGVCLIFAGCALLRLPVTVADLFERIQDGQLIYYRSSEQLSPGMKRILAPTYHQFLNPRQHLRLPRLQDEVFTTMTSLTEQFNLTFPPLNHQLVLWSWLQTLLLPLELHAFTLTLAHHLGITFTYAPIPYPQRTLSLPENRLAVLLLIATKLLHPPDGHERFPRRPTDPSALSLHWPTWTTAVSSRPKRQSAFRSAMVTKESDVLRLSDDQIDQFLALFAALHPNRTRTRMASLFPDVPGVPELRPPERGEWDPGPLEEVQGGMRSVRVIVGRDAEIDRPGCGYARFKTEGELTGYARELYAAVAECSGMEVGTLVRDVFAVERELDQVGGGKRE